MQVLPKGKEEPYRKSIIMVGVIRDHKVSMNCCMMWREAPESAGRGSGVDTVKTTIPSPWRLFSCASELRYLIRGYQVSGSSSHVSTG